MGAVPKHKISSHRQGRRRATHKQVAPAVIDCSQCGQKKKPHHACPSCGAK
jgi:large subunit ribosomal protein L32